MKLFTRKICKNCKWWEEHNESEGFCRLLNLPWMEEFTEIKSREITENIIAPACWAKHDEVRTSPDFGCNQWKEI